MKIYALRENIFTMYNFNKKPSLLNSISCIIILPAYLVIPRMYRSKVKGKVETSEQQKVRNVQFRSKKMHYEMELEEHNPRHHISANTASLHGPKLPQLCCPSLSTDARFPLCTACWICTNAVNCSYIVVTTLFCLNWIGEFCNCIECWNPQKSFILDYIV